MSDAILERLRKADGPDQELNLAINEWVCEHVSHWELKTIPADYDGENVSEILVPPGLSKDFAYPPKGRIAKGYFVPREPVTASLDAAVALVERLLPDAIWDVSSTGCAWIMVGDDQFATNSGKTPPLALLIALFEALKSRQTESPHPAADDRRSA